MKILLTTLVFALSSASSLAGTATDEATQHINSIATGDTVSVLKHYQESATMQWLGGPLDGTYTGKEQLSSLWGKFTKAQGPMKIKIANIVEHSNPKGATVTADVFFNGNKNVPVHYVLSYRDGMLVSEIWQVSPSLASMY